jgi:hypothetical protein
LSVAVGLALPLKTSAVIVTSSIRRPRKKKLNNFL